MSGIEAFFVCLLWGDLYVFEPQKDITPYEIATICAHDLCKQANYMLGTRYLQMPDNIRRHFALKEKQCHQ